jgi:general secretion pathway protein F
MKYEVRGLRGGLVETASVDALSEGDARRVAAELQLDVLSVKSSRAAWRRPPKFDLGMFSQELAELLDAGLSVVEAVDTLSQQQRQQDASSVYAELVKLLRQGHSFSVALEKMPSLFPPLYVGLIRAAELTSDLRGALLRYLEYSGRLDGMRNRIVSALIYPAILFCVGGAVVIFLLAFVVPRFAAVYQGSGRELPLLSALLLRWGSFAAAHAHALIGATLVLLVVGGLVFIQAQRTGALERLVNLLPGVRHRVNLFRLSRLYMTVGTLLNGGMPLLQALALCRGVVGGAHRLQLDATTEALRRGGAISDSLEQHHLTTPVSSRLLRAGEGTGRMGDLFIRAGRYHDHELGRWIERFSKAFEPILMAVIGFVIGGIVVLLYIPIFDLAGSLQ